MNCASCRGLTLTEILVAGMLALSIVIGASVVGRQRDAFMTQIRGQTLSIGEEVQPAVAVMGMVRTLETADRARMPASGVIQARVPAPQGVCAGAPYGGCLDDPANFQWVEYAYADTNGDNIRDALERYADTANGCARRTTLSTRITAMTFNYVDVAGPPPGGDPAAAVFSPRPRDMNLVQYVVQWTGPLSGAVLVPPGGRRQYIGTVAMRNVPYSDNGAGAAGLTDSGLGLTNSTVASPPTPPCCRPPRCA